ncbi:copper amine oxidase N-terminal domain-containing protein [Paenibacillus sp.]|uniref:copper amine oxidase N-terminal domain-containing protein n=1 Tax=Paenibacillus sp. TaxID=58172 RepID=UPI002D649E20|nr:copper amine oxidase N-terminal domain-containing protein [Paenibacillus sp.]HZG57864.1 copper amine oxidase N-terminal domain-containing protein [Paenibacillus sp.]
MMKKLAASVTAIAMAGSLFAGTAFGAELKMIVKGKPLVFASGTPFVENGSSLMPLRDLLIGLGVQASDIAWDGATSTVTAKYGDIVVTLKVGDKAIYKNGAKFKDLEVPAKQVNGRVFLPARAIAEAFGNSVGFDPATNSVIIEEAKGGSSAAGSGSASAGGSASNATAAATFKTKGGIEVTLPSTTVGAGQIAGFVYDYDPATGTVTLKLADGTEKKLTLVDATKLTFVNGHSYTGKQYKAYFQSGVGVVAAANADGSLKELKVVTLEITGVVEQVTTDSYDAVDANGNATKMTLTDVYVNVSGQSVRFTTSEALTVTPKVGDSVTVQGSVSESDGYVSGHLLSLKIN